MIATYPSHSYESRERLEGQLTYQETDIISHSALVAVGYANITNELTRINHSTSKIKLREHTSGAKG